MAELVATESSADQVFSAVAEEVGMLLGVSSSAVLRFDADNTVVVLAAWGVPDMGRQIGRRLPIEGDNTAALVLKTGRPARMDDQSTASGPIAVNSLEPEPLPPDTEERVGKFTELVATAIANVQARADLAASRARIVAASDETRRRFERNLHDGVQQRLVSLALAVRVAQTMLPPDLDDPHQQLSRVSQGLTDVLKDLRELSRRSAISIKLRLKVNNRLSEPIEVAAYLVVSETLANVAKHARASLVEISAEATNRLLDLTIRDDGIGGADLNHGSGLIGLGDRVDALGGTIAIVSRAGQGTSIHVELPLGTNRPAVGEKPRRASTSS